jgi:RNase H-like protein
VRSVVACLRPDHPAACPFAADSIEPDRPQAVKAGAVAPPLRGFGLDGLMPPRSGLFVDLYSVVRNGIRASVESYSIKKLEPLYGYERITKLSDANKALANVQTALELNDLGSLNEKHKDAVESYNRDDCLSTLGLRDWLEWVRSKLVETGETINRPVQEIGIPSETLSDWQIKINGLIERITNGIPAEIQERTKEQHACWILAHILDWHRREEKAIWWEYFRLRGLSSEELLDERAGLSGLEFVANAGGTQKAPIHRYRFPPQETEFRGDESLHKVGGAKFGTVHAISLDDRTIDIKKREDSADFHPEAVFAHKVIDTKVIANALVRLGEYPVHPVFLDLAGRDGREAHVAEERQNMEP